MTAPDWKQIAEQKVAAVRHAQVAWAALPVQARVAKLTAASLAILARGEELAALIAEETKKPLAEAYSAEVLGVGDLFGYWGRKGPELLKPRKGEIPSLEMPGKKAWIERAPRGVVVCISPWNYPVSLPMRTIAPTLVAGNGLILKPSEATPKSGVWLVERIREVIGPVIDVLDGDGPAGAALIEAMPDAVVFTGSTRTGRKVAVMCAERGIPCELELGGKDCAVVLADCDLERTAAGVAWGILTNAGQNCSGIERVAVSAQIAPQFVPLLVEKLKQAAKDIPDLVTPMQRRLVLSHIEDAIARGAEVLTGGMPEGDAPIAPTLLTKVPRDALAWKDESFGPIAVLEVHTTEDQLIAAANDTRYGLGNSVWSKNTERATAVAKQVRSGMVWINNHSFTGALADLPWVGLGDSGTGMTNSPDVLHLLTRPRLYVVDSNKDVEPWWYPYGPKMVDLMRILVSRQQTGGLGATLKTLGALKARMKEIKS
jgi:acyl-CoA reductase-like NAD-dependent aldehyde dehydrogenase